MYTDTSPQIMNGSMAMPVSPMMAPVFNPNVKDSRWLTLEVCREFTRNKCTRSDQECKFAHPPPHVEVQNGRVTCCFDSIKGKCQRKDPPCKYLHPPQHLKEQLLQNGRNNLILKNLQMQTMAMGAIPQVMPGLVPTVAYENSSNGKTTYSLPAAHMLGQYMTPQYMMAQHPGTFNPYVNNCGMVQDNSVPVSVSSGSPHQVPAGLIQTQALSQKVPRADRLEGLNPGMVPLIKRQTTAENKSGMPMYQPLGGNAYQQAIAAMQLQQQYVPVTTGLQLLSHSHLSSHHLSSGSHDLLFAGHPPGLPRF